MSQTHQLTFEPLTDWLSDPRKSRAIVLEEGDSDAESPLTRWSEQTRRDRENAKLKDPEHTDGSSRVIVASMGPVPSLFLARDVLAALYAALYPEDLDDPAKSSFFDLRDSVRLALAGPEVGVSLLVLSRINLAEAAFGEHLPTLLARVRPDQKVAISFHVEPGREPDVAAWMERLGWREEEVACLRLTAGPPEEASPRDEDGCRAEGHDHEYVLSHGEAALRGEVVCPCVIRRYGAILGEREGLSAQTRLVTEAWAKAWSPLQEPLGYEADVARAWFVAERALLASVSGPPESRAEPLLAIFRCAQVSFGIMASLRDSPDEARALLPASPGQRLLEASEAVLRIAESRPEPERSRLEAHVIDAFLMADLTVTEVALIPKLIERTDSERREALRAKALATVRAEVADWASSVWLLRAAPLLDAPEREALCEEVLSQLTELTSHQAVTLQSALDSAPPDVAPRLARGADLLPPPDRFRFVCSLAPHLEGEARREMVKEILDQADLDTWPFREGGVRSAVRALSAEQTAHLARALKKVEYGESLVGECLRALLSKGEVALAESVAGDDVAAMPFDWVLALAAGSPSARPSLRGEVERRLAEESASDPIRFAWTLHRDAAELVLVLGVHAMLPLLQPISTHEERIVARLALVPFASDATKAQLVSEAVRVLRSPRASGDLRWQELLSHWRWMSPEEACHVLIHGAHESNGIWSIEDLPALTAHLAGPAAPLQIAEQMIEVSRWVP